MYGYAPLAQEKMPIELKPALSVYSKIVALQSLETGAGVSYNQRRKTQSPCKVATIPFGYSEGLLRSLSGKLSYRWQGQDCAQLGTICMNLSSCLGNEQMQIGDEIELISSEK